MAKKASKTPTSLLDLPSELRNKIYRLVLGVNRLDLRIGIKIRLPALIYVNRQTRAQVASIVFKHYIGKPYVYYPKFKPEILPFFAAIRDYQKYLQKMQLTLRNQWFDDQRKTTTYEGCPVDITVLGGGDALELKAACEVSERLVRTIQSWLRDDTRAQENKTIDGTHLVGAFMNLMDYNPPHDMHGKMKPETVQFKWDGSVRRIQ